MLVDASWGKEIGNLLVLSKLEESLDLLAKEIVKELSWRRSFLSESSFLAIISWESLSLFCRDCIWDFRSVMVDSRLDEMDL